MDHYKNNHFAAIFQINSPSVSFLPLKEESATEVVFVRPDRLPVTSQESAWTVAPPLDTLLCKQGVSTLHPVEVGQCVVRSGPFETSPKFYMQDLSPVNTWHLYRACEDN